MRLICAGLLIFSIASYASAQPAAIQPAAIQPTTRTSLWGPAAGGLQGRLQAPVEVEQNAALPVTLELQCDPDFLPKGVRKLNTLCYPAHFQLQMVNVASGKQFQIEPYDPTEGMLCPDDGTEFFELDGKSTARLDAEIPLRTAGPDLQPGDYDCTMSYSTARVGNTRLMDDPVFWTGEVVSAPLRVRVIPEVQRKQTILVPTRMRIDADGQIRFHLADAEPLEFVVGNGMFINTEVDNADGSPLGENGGPPIMDGTDTVGALVHLKPGEAMTYSIKVFLSDDPPCHLLSPPVSRVLWTKTFTVVAPTTRP